jgi:hypothetical protein
MSPHPWLQSLETIAICPVCKAPALKRSHTRTSFERFRKKHTLKRPFRCHHCKWRGWIDETHLSYPAKLGEPIPFTHNQTDDIPTIEDDASETLTRADAPIRRLPDQVVLPSLQEDDIPPAIDLPSPEIRTATDESGNSFKDDEKGVSELFEDAPERTPFSQSVPADFHSGSRPVGKPCPNCQKNSLYRSRHRNALELIRKKITRKRQYRCHKCGWRGWLPRQT